MAKRPSTKVEGSQHVHAANNASVHTKKRPPVLRYRKKVLDVLPEQQPNDDNQLDELDDTTSSNHDNQSSHESSPVKVHPIPTASSKVYVVTVQDFLFHPRHIVVEQHSTIRWEIPANSTTVHSIAVDKAAKKKGTGRTLSPDSPTFEHTFDTLGSIRYSCSLYSFMTGTVTVVASLTPEQISRNVVFLDYPSHPAKKQPKSPPKAASPTTFPFHKQLVMWREKQPAPQVSKEDDDTFAHKSRQRIKTKAAAVKAAPSSTPATTVPPPSLPAASSSSTTSSLYVTPLSSPSRASHHVVRIQDFDFSPLEKAHVHVGDSLAWQVSPENPGMVEHALKLRVVDGGNAIVQTATSPPLKPGDSWGFELLQPCSLSVECVVYDLTSPTIHVVANTQKPAPDNVILIGDVACPVAASVPAAKPAEPVEPEDTILQLLHKSTLKQKATRSSYVVENGRGIPGFDAAATYDLLKLRAHRAKQEPRVVYACSRHTM